jgi:hypothetical protein
MILANLKPEGSSPTTMLTIAKRALNATSGQFQPFNANAQVVRELTDDRISVGEVNELDGQYIILVTAPKNVAQGNYTFILSPRSSRPSNHWTDILQTG